MATFCPPNVYGPSALGLDALVDFHLYNNPNYPFAHLTPRDGHPTTVTWRELAEAVHRAGHALKDSIGPFDAASPPVVAIFAPDDGLIYTTIQLAIIRIGLIVSPPPNSATRIDDCSSLSQSRLETRRPRYPTCSPPRPARTSSRRKDRSLEMSPSETLLASRSLASCCFWSIAISSLYLSQT